MKEALQLRLDAQSHSLYGVVVDAIHSTSSWRCSRAHTRPLQLTVRTAFPPGTSGRAAAENEADVELRAALTTMFLLSLPQWVYPTKVAQLMAVRSRSNGAL